MALVKNHAAILVKDNEAQLTLLDRAENLLADHREQKQLSEAILRMAKPDATKEIVDTIIETAR
jgi:UDP-N-acetylglucosamine--N-acetylmuramyl-(pentapeptide) pyrophosphoryl-undecaprenol N-acetylglucosamine transferase